MARPRLVSDEAILDAARACVFEHGAAVSTTVIAEAVGVSQATIFKRFGTKEDLIVRALMPPPDMELDWIVRLERGPAPGPLEPQFQEMVREMVNFFEHMVPLMALLKGACLMKHAMTLMTAHGEDAPPIRGRRAIAGWLRCARADGRIGDSDPDVAAIALTGAAQGMAWRRHMLNETLELSAEDYASQLANLLWAGLAPKEGA